MSMEYVKLVKQDISYMITYVSHSQSAVLNITEKPVCNVKKVTLSSTNNAMD